MDLSRRVNLAFEERFGGAPAFLVRAPGRVNLIGEHTDYNDGFCLPMAIDRAIWVALRPRPDGRVVAHSLDMAETVDFSLSDLTAGAMSWPEYLKGMSWALRRDGFALSGWEGVISGDIPIGSGLSSSAALEMAVARAFAAVSGFEWQPRRMAQIGRQTENEWLGLGSGIMDQLISAAAVEGHAMLMDCRSLSLEPAPLPAGVSVVVMDTRTPRDLVESAYNERRAECDRAAQALGVPALRDVSPVNFERQAERLTPVIRRRARHVITENARTLQAAQAMRRADPLELGRLMDAGHASLRDDYEVSSYTLDTMVAIARRQPGCLGARMTGAGFGGCAIALVRDAATPLFIETVSREYSAATGLAPSLFACRAVGGAALVSGGRA